MTITTADIMTLAMNASDEQKKDLIDLVLRGEAALNSLREGDPWPPDMEALGAPPPFTLQGRFWRFGFVSAGLQRWGGGTPVRYPNRSTVETVLGPEPINGHTSAGSQS